MYLICIYTSLRECVCISMFNVSDDKKIKIIVSHKNKGNGIVKNKSCVKLKTSRRRKRKMRKNKQ